MAEYNQDVAFNPGLYQKIGQDDLKQLEEMFISKEGQKFTMTELEDVLEQLNISIPVERMKLLFSKVANAPVTSTSKL